MSDIYLDHWFENKMIRSNLYVYIRYHKKSFHLTSHVEYSLDFLSKKEDVCWTWSREILYRYYHVWIVIERLRFLWSSAGNYSSKLWKLWLILPKPDTLKRRRRLQKKPFSTKKCQQWLKSQTRQVIHISFFYEFDLLCLNFQTI